MRTAAGYLGKYARADAPIDEDRECLDCGYNLRGLRTGGECPECGSPITRPRAGDDPLSRMPLPVIRRFRAAALLAAPCIFVMAIMFVLRFGGFCSDRSVWMAGFVAMPFWLLAVIGLTPAIRDQTAASYGFSRKGRLRLIARWSQLGWVIVAGAAAAQHYWPSGALAQVSGYAVTVGFFVGAIGLIALALMMERLAHWTRDDHAERLFGWFIWGLGGFVLLQLIPVPLFLLSWILTAFAIVGVLLFPLGVLSLAASIALSAEHWREEQYRNDRRRQRREKEQAELNARLDGIDRGAPNNVERGTVS